MNVTGYRTLTTHHDWGRIVGDVNGVSSGTRTAVQILVLETDVGLEGIALGPHPAIERIFPVVAGGDPREVQHLYNRMLAATFKLGHDGSTFATMGALDCALWDLKAKLADQPLWRLLGGADRFVPGYASGLDYGLSDEELVQLQQRFADHGFTSAKLKGGRHLADDLRRLGLTQDVLQQNTATPG